MRHAIWVSLVFSLACADSMPQHTDETLDAGPALRGTLVDGLPMCGSSVPCCEASSSPPSDEWTGRGTVTDVEVNESGRFIVHVSRDGSSERLHFAVQPDVAIGDEVSVERTSLGQVVRDADGVLGVSSAVGEAPYEVELAIGDQTLRFALTCYGFVPHRGASFGCPDALIAEYALELGTASVAAGEQAEVVIGDDAYFVQNTAIRHRTARADGECADVWPSVMEYEIVRRGS